MPSDSYALSSKERPAGGKLLAAIAFRLEVSWELGRVVIGNTDGFVEWYLLVLNDCLEVVMMMMMWNSLVRWCATRKCFVILELANRLIRLQKQVLMLIVVAALSLQGLIGHKGESSYSALLCHHKERDYIPEMVYALH